MGEIGAGMQRGRTYCLDHSAEESDACLGRLMRRGALTCALRATILPSRHGPPIFATKMGGRIGNVKAKATTMNRCRRFDSHFFLSLTRGEVGEGKGRGGEGRKISRRHNQLVAKGTS